LLWLFTLMAGIGVGRGIFQMITDIRDTIVKILTDCRNMIVIILTDIRDTIVAIVKSEVL